MKSKYTVIRVGSLSVRLITLSICIALALPLALIKTSFANSKTASQADHSTARTLSLEQRVEYQRRIEEVYWRHRIWPAENHQPKPALDEVMPRQAMRAKVEDYLRKSTALASYWQRPITDAQLESEVNRMAAQTKQPERLAELFAAMDNDAFIIAECLARPLLVERFVRNWHAYDERFHGEVKAQAEASLLAYHSVAEMRRMSGKYRETTWRKANPGSEQSNRETDSVALTAEAWDEQAVQLQVGVMSGLQEEAERFYVSAPLSKDRHSMKVATVEWRKPSFDDWWDGEKAKIAFDEATVSDYRFSLSQASAPTSCTDDTWTATQGPPAARSNHTAVWTGSEMFIWGGLNISNGQQPGGKYNPATDTWSVISLTNEPANGGTPAASFWTGSEVVIWGGTVAQGGRYNPMSDSWAAINPSGAPSVNTAAVWTGSEMLAWSIDTNGVIYHYNPSSNAWTSVTSTGAPTVSNFFSPVVWAGTEMVFVLWQGNSFDGRRYNPSTNTWSTINPTNAPQQRSAFVVVWTGQVLIIWGGVSAGFPVIAGGRYNLATNSWTTMSATNAFGANSSTAVWTGTEMIVWGGVGGGPQSSTTSLSTGGRYNPTTDIWQATNLTNRPLSRYGHTAVWTGSEMIVWGGTNRFLGTDRKLSTGGRYNPATDSWVRTNSNVPEGRLFHTAVWTGTEMIVWGGYDGSSALDTGGRYNPSTNSWTGTGAVNRPLARYAHTAVWSGSEMLVWGGHNSSTSLNSGGRYDPAADSWTNISATSAPNKRENHTAIWNGSEMIVWGGLDFGASRLDSGGRYNPTSDSWTPTNSTTPPTPRELHTAVWTGSVMIIWGGLSGGTVQTGSRYSPATDSWSPTNFSTAPSARSGHTAVWTGAEMIIWGSGNLFLPSGGRYNPSTDAWQATGMTNVPVGRVNSTAVWTGSQMIVWGGSITSSGVTSMLDSGGRYCDTVPPSCSFSLTPSSQNFTAASGAGSVSVTATSGCNWIAGSNASFISISAGTSGTGNGTVNYSVSTNTGGARTGMMTIAGQTFTVTQDAAAGGCSSMISPTNHTFTAGAQSSTVNVTAGVGCNWTAVSNASFITVNSGSSGSGNGAVGYSVTANAGAARTGTMTIAAQTFNVTQDSPTGSKASFDFDADRRTDLSLWNPSNGQWTGPISGTSVLGQSTDMIVPADYDGDIKTDIAVWRPSNGLWTIIQSATNQSKTVFWGINGDVPVPADYDGDGKADIAIWRPSNSTWYIINSSNSSVSTALWGISGDVPVPGDYDGDGKADIAMWRPSNGTWYIINSLNGSVSVYGWGISGDKAVAADYDGDGKTDVGIWRPSNGTWYIINSSNGSITVYGWGISSDIAVPADYDGDIKTDIAVWRPSTGTWYIVNSSDGSIRAQMMGSSGNIPVPSAYIK
ncbi:MAG: hypothetical protein V7641_4163 [Blastocatellia bacterium]